MASEVSWEFDELRAYIKRLVADLDGDVSVKPAEVGVVHGPGAGTVNAATPFRMELKFTALAFGRALDSYYTELRQAHDKLAEVLAAAVEADASLGDEAREIAALIEQAAGSATPAPKGVSTPTGGVSSTPAGQIG